MAFLCYQVVLLSATMPADVLEVTTKFMREPVRILVKKEELTLEGIKQFYINVEREVRHWLSLMSHVPSFKKHHAKITSSRLSGLALVFMLVLVNHKEGRAKAHCRK